MTEMQFKLVNMLEWFHDFCEKNNLKYFIIAGTMLGAVRHGGFIPWDDDIDVGMPREDYEKLRDISSNINNKYLFEYPDVKKKDFPFLWAKLYDTSTTLIEKQRYKTKRGIYIDIFPLDGIGNDMENAINNFKPIQKQLNLNSIISFSILKRRKWYKNIPVLFGRIISPIFVNKCKLAKRLDDMCKKYDFYTCDMVCNLMGGSGIKGIVKREYFGEPTLIKFEDIFVYGLEKPDLYLKSMYGNYMTLPPEEKRISFHDRILLDLNKGYKE